MTLFEEKVYKIVRRIPKGRVATYQAVAKAIGAPQVARAVGNALNKNPFSYEACPEPRRRVPCHRVVRSDGSVGGFALGARQKTQVLRKEGIVIKNGKIDLKKFGFKA
jgi:O-6-methylguanine DNA methyltransferase